MVKNVPGNWHHMVILYNDLFNVMRYMIDHPRRGETQAETQYDIYLCWDEQDRVYTIRAVPFQKEPADVKPVKRIAGWSANTEDPGSLYLHMLEGIRNMFGLDGLLPPRGVLEKHPYSMDYIK